MTRALKTWRLPALPELAAALPDLGMAVFCGMTWASPLRFGPETVSWLVLVMILEFFVVHSAGFMTGAMLHPERVKK